MNLLIVALIFTALLSSSVEAAVCSANPCQLGGYFTAQRGYQCIQKDASTAICTCPGAVEENVPCRLCNRVNSVQNVCRNTNGRLLQCLEDDSFGTSYACLCSNPDGTASLTVDTDCDTSITLTTPPTTTIATLAPSSLCINGGVFYNSVCQCPSGYSGPYCGDNNVANLCDRVVCLNNGVCAVRNPNGPYEGICLCRYGTWGEYCELTGTLGFCSSGSCMNGGACKENVIGTTRHAYCRCPAGYNGVKCENRYFVCPGVGQYADPIMFTQGKYFDCTNVGGTLRIEQKSCPRGLRYNANVNLCTY